MCERVCNNCEWFVEETETIGDYQHKEAVKKGKGFCLLEDLFYDVTPDTPACEEYQQEKNQETKQNDITGTDNKTANTLP